MVTGTVELINGVKPMVLAVVRNPMYRPAVTSETSAWEMPFVTSITPIPILVALIQPTVLIVRSRMLPAVDNVGIFRRWILSTIAPQVFGPAAIELVLLVLWTAQNHRKNLRFRLLLLATYMQVPGSRSRAIAPRQVSLLRVHSRRRAQHGHRAYPALSERRQWRQLQHIQFSPARSPLSRSRVLRLNTVPQA